METDWSVASLDGRDDVTLVTVTLRNPSPVDRRVRVTNCLDGRVLPPRRRGVPESGWDEAGFEGVVPADGRRVLGYACSAPATRPPVSVTEEGRANDESAAATETVVRDLGDARPPADALPTREASDETEEESAARGVGDSDGDGVPAAVDDWLEDIIARVERGERLTDASVETVTAALESSDGSVADLDAQIDADAAALAAVERRVSELGERADTVNVPVDALRRLS